MTAALIVLGLAALPFCMTLANLFRLGLPPLPRAKPRIAILIPARNEQDTIEGCVTAALDSRAADVEVIVMDDHSTDRTAAIVQAMAARDYRVRLVRAPSLPPGWNGKQHACWSLSQTTDRPYMLFVDADVRLGPEAAARLVPPSGIHLVSGVPRQIVEGWAERMIIPMINTLLFGYLPIGLMRRDGRPALAAGCGQMMMVDAQAYRRCHGHAGIRDSMHDGLKLPRLFRQHGFKTDLVAGASLATCRMYDGAAAVWAGFSKNATEGMARPVALPVWTLLLFGGHVLPWILLVYALMSGRSWAEYGLLGAACLLPLLARMLQARACGEQMRFIWMHPFGVAMTLVIQWSALLRRALGREIAWRGRTSLAKS